MILDTLRKRLHRENDKTPGRWLKELLAMVWGLRTQPSHNTGVSPYFMVYGAEAVLLADIAFRSPRVKNYDKDILVPLIRLVDENGFVRGSVGQSVYALIDLSVSDNASKLSAIINDHALESKVRIDSLLLYCFIEQEKAERLLVTLCEQETDEELRGWAKNLLKDLKKEGFFYN